MTKDIFDSCVRNAGDLAGVFEYTDNVGHFYLYDVRAGIDLKVLGSIHILSGSIELAQDDFAIRWSAGDRRVGLFIQGTLWAVFDVPTKSSYGGAYQANSLPSIPPELSLEYDQ